MCVHFVLLWRNIWHSGNCLEFLKNAFHIPEERLLGLASLILGAKKSHLIEMVLLSTHVLVEKKRE